MFDVRTRDHGAVRLLDAVSTPIVIDVGVIGPKASVRHKGSRATVVQIVSWNEYGTKRTPQRSMIGGWFDANLGAITTFVKKANGLRLQGKIDDRQYVELVGSMAVGGITRRIAQGIAPPNAPSTIRRKKSSKPLIDTGVCRSSFTYRRAL